MLSDFANKDKDFHPSKIAYIQSINSGDHGKGKLRFGAKLVVGLKDGSKSAAVYPLGGDAKCKKDNG